MFVRNRVPQWRKVLEKLYSFGYSRYFRPFRGPEDFLLLLQGPALRSYSKSQNAVSKLK